jgi:hypothetical protein
MFELHKRSGRSSIRPTMFRRHMVTTTKLLHFQAVIAAVSLCLAACSSSDESGPKQIATGGAGASATAGTGSATGTSGTASAGHSAANGGAGGQTGAKAGTGAAGSTKAGSGAVGSAGTSGTSAGTAGTDTSQAGSVAPGPVAAKPNDDPAIIAFTSNLAASVCKALLGCLGQQKLDSFIGREDCQTRFTAAFSQSSFGTLQQSVEANRVKFHQDMLQKCYDDTEALACEIQNRRLPDSCQAAIEGQIAVGDVCSNAGECSGDAFCSQGACPRTCQTRAALGANCGSDDECASGGYCAQGKCTKPAAVTEACGGDTALFCTLGASCIGNTVAASGMPAKAGACKLNSDIQIHNEGETCQFTGELCVEGLSCAYNGTNGFTCQAAVPSGGTCRPAVPTMCPNGEFCDQTDISKQGSCKGLPTDGQACVLSGACAAGHVCVADGSSAVCKKIGALGDACTANGFCRSGYCIDASCGLPPVCE